MDREITKSYPVHLPDVIDRSYESDIINEKYDFIQEIIREVLVNKDRQDALTEKADKVLNSSCMGCSNLSRHYGGSVSSDIYCWGLAERVFRDRN